MSQSAESFVGEKFCAEFQKNSGSGNFYGLESGLSRFSVESFFVPQPRKLWRRNPLVLCFRKLPVAKKIVDKRGGGVSSFSVENFLSHNAENFRKVTVCVVFQKTSESEKLCG